MYAGFNQTCDIFRPDQSITGKKKDTTESPIVANMDCSIQPLADTSMIAAMGWTALEMYRGFFPGEADLQFGDLVVLQTEADDLFFKVDAETTFRSPGTDLPYLTEVALKRTKIR